jgi:hypothetical protein
MSPPDPHKIAKTPRIVPLLSRPCIELGNEASCETNRFGIAVRLI